MSAIGGRRQPDEHARAIEPILGHWQLVGENAGSPPTPVEGDEFHERMDGGFFITARWIRRFAGGPHQGVSVLGYEPERGAIMLHNFDNLGYARDYRVDIAGNVWTLTGPYERATYTFAGDTFTAMWERTQDGRTWSPLCTLKATRR